MILGAEEEHVWFGSKPWSWDASSRDHVRVMFSASPVGKGDDELRSTSKMVEKGRKRAEGSFEMLERVT